MCLCAQVHVLKGLSLDGPLLLPVAEDLPFLARPLSPKERLAANEVVKRWGLDGIEESMPISVVGTGADLNKATQNGLERAASLFNTTVPEIKNRATITGAVDIGRAPGVVHITFRAPLAWLEATGLKDIADEQYGEHFA